MYRITIYEVEQKTVDEMEDEDELRSAVDSALNDIEGKHINSFTVSRISKNNYSRPWWEDKK